MASSGKKVLNCVLPYNRTITISSYYEFDLLRQKKESRKFGKGGGGGGRGDILEIVVEIRRGSRRIWSSCDFTGVIVDKEERKKEINR